MRRIKIAGVDPSMTHTGIAVGYYDLDAKDFEVEKVVLIKTEKGKTKTVRQNSDDLRRSQEQAEVLYLELSDCEMFFSEIPTGAQSARAALAFGIVIGLMAGIVSSPGFRPAFVQVLPQQVKLAIPGGSKVTSKEEIVEWAIGRWTGLEGWKTNSPKKATYVIDGQGYTADNEHMADACAAIAAGVRTDEFRNYVALLERVIKEPCQAQS